MPTLRITQISEGPDHYRAELALQGEGHVRQTTAGPFAFQMTPQEHEDLRWYLEDFLQYPHDPAPKIAKRVEKWIEQKGVELFEAVFQGGGHARNFWETLRGNLSGTRVEIVTTVEEATSIPWELIRNPEADAPLATQAGAFVRTEPSGQQSSVPRLESGPIRILLVICRPMAGQDVPFRSVAKQLITGIDEDARKLFQLDVLRPPTFEHLGRVLEAAKADGQPYHVVHFDGHGTYEDIHARYSGNMSANGRGYLVFENQDVEGHQESVNGARLGALLTKAGVPLLVLNACRSAHSEGPAKPGEAPEDQRPPAFGSLAQEVMQAGVTGVVAMRYNVYVVTAARFVAELYAHLTQGSSLGEAVTLGRKRLAADPLREIAFEPRPLQDWLVPAVYEAAPLELFSRKASEPPPEVTLLAAPELAERNTLDDNIGQRPAIGFIGRDETLLALDRAFDTHHSVLLHAYAGEGKTATAVEFARWYALTGGIEGPVIFTSFEQHWPIGRVIDQIERVFPGVLEQDHINWLALDDVQRREVALQVLNKISVLWIWDNIEPVAGFPTGAKSAWSEEEQQELVDFLRDASKTRAKFLLTSRRDERGWLSELPHRIKMPPMPMQERVQFARELAEKLGRRLTNVSDWWPLLRFTGGNPLTITVLVGQALQDRLESCQQIEKFVDQLCTGDVEFEDNVREGRSISLEASLSYGFEHAFDQDDRRRLALLHLFQGFVQVSAFRLMGEPKFPWCLPELRALSRDTCIILLDRAAEVGLLTAHGNGYYSIHPAVRWFCKRLLPSYLPAQCSSSSEATNPSVLRVRAYVEAIGAIGHNYHDQYLAGNTNAVAVLAAEEGNLLYALRLAREHGQWLRLIQTMEGLSTLYHHKGQWAEWARLVEDIVPDFVDPATDGPLVGQEEQWISVNQHRMRLLEREGRRTEAERLQRVAVEISRRRAASALAAGPETPKDAQREAIKELSISLEQLGQLLRIQGKPECVGVFEEAIVLDRRLGDRDLEAITTANLGDAFRLVPALCDLDRAESCYRRCLELTDERNLLFQSHCLERLGIVATQRFREARAEERAEDEMLKHLLSAARFYEKVLATLPPDSADELASIHNSIGTLYGEVGAFDESLAHLYESLRWSETSGDTDVAGQTRYNIAVTLARMGRFADALDYAHAALRNLETCDGNVTQTIKVMRRLMLEIERAMLPQGD